MKLMKKMTVVLALSSLAIVPISSSVISLTEVQATTPATAPQRELSLGASLTAQEAEQTKQLLGANNLPIDNTIYVDGTVVNQYLQDGSNQNTGVFSSALIEKLPEGSGVQVQVITPQNILVVKPTTYQNAAITSGAKDVLIKIATVKPVTGEGALAGVYALFEKAGLKVDQKSIVVAEKEIQLVEQAKKENQVTDVQINKIIVEMKTQITNTVVNNQEVNIDTIVQTIINNNSDIKLSNETIEFLKQVAKDYSETEAAKNKDTVDQLDKSIKEDANKPYAVDLNQFGGHATFKRDGDGIPHNIQVSLLDKRVYLMDSKATYELTTENIDTKELTAIAQDGSTRQVKVNTVLNLKPVADTGAKESEDLYLFFNNSGTISLLTPDYSGQAGQEGMLEYVLTETPTQTDVEEPSLEDFPYMVDLNILQDKTYFVREGMNIPNGLNLAKNDLTLAYDYPEQESQVSNIEITNIPTQDIRVFSADGSGIRDIKVNTVIRSKQGSENLFLFVNKDGGISLATPNYAGNVDESEKDVMLEYLVGTQPEAPAEESTEAPAEETTEAPTEENTDDFPYMVDLSHIAGETPFFNPGMNIPNNIIINTDANSVTFKAADGSEPAGTATFTNIPTKEIRIFSHDGSGIRNVKVNTVIQIEGIEGDFANEMYLFQNANGGVSLATPNYAGNVEEADRDVMIEYLVGEYVPEDNSGNEEAVDPSQYPFMVDKSEVSSDTLFGNDGMNIPNEITLNSSEETVSFVYPDTEPQNGEIKFEVVPEKEIRVNSHDGSGVRNVKVNTVIKVSGLEGDLAKDMYLFHNAQGGISLATPNYAGNTDEENQDVMIEYLVK
ncbi:DUF1002 domain-containing protein [Globicatella sulfidifaciens]|uniref:DUF1002 domain-containing protein n=1 Tax=Globicatella sulfidifaciens TaxID=136093 RepID=UPI00289235C3|nr:DUF1002 domain-containing protein [Globicatella sulfidifaciens]MDT2768652.1 DUF1002 domain-containing protein [Globicatella sulfidifaciens]